MLTETDFISLTSILLHSNNIERHLRTHLLLYGLPRYHHVTKGIRATDVCNICIDKLDTNVVRLRCKHLYHENCLKLWMKRSNTCPTCRFIF